MWGCWHNGKGVVEFRKGWIMFRQKNRLSCKQPLLLWSPFSISVRNQQIIRKSMYVFPFPITDFKTETSLINVYWTSLLCHRQWCVHCRVSYKGKLRTISGRVRLLSGEKKKSQIIWPWRDRIRFLFRIE